MPDPSLADVAVVRVVASVVVAILAALGIWGRFFKTRRTVSGDEGERIRFEDAIKDAREARKEAHDAFNRIMEVQHKIGGLEAENRYCQAQNKVLTDRVSILEKQNSRQATEIVRLGGKSTFNPADTTIE